MTSAATERALVGDSDAFRELAGPHLPELHRHCYRMLGSLDDADDVMQEVLLAAWQGLEGFADRSSLRTWLYRIATNRCLNAIRAGARCARPAPVPPFDPPEPSRRDAVTWLQPYPDSHIDELHQAADRAPGPAERYQTQEAIQLAFVAAVQRLPPRQTAVLLLRDVLAFTPGEVAGMLETTPAAVKRALQRARASMAQHLATGVTDAAHRGSPAELDLARRFADAFTRDDVEAVVDLLSDDAWLAMPPAPHQYHGPEAIAAFLDASRRWRAGRPFRLIPTRANNQPAFGCYLAEPDGSAAPVGMIVLTTSRHQITHISRFLDPALPGRFGLPTAVK